MTTETARSIDPTPRPTRSRRGLPAAIVAAVLGLAYAALNAYWAAGGHRWLDEYGSHLIGRARPGDTTFRASSAVLAVLFVAVVVLVLAAVTVPFDSPARVPVRWLAWVGAGLVALYGFCMTVVGLAVQAGIGDVTSADPELFKWHAFFWDPWFLLWGVLMVVALLQSARAYVQATGRDPV